MIPEERRWASPAAAVLAFCLTLVMFAPPTLQPMHSTSPASAIADGVATFTAHAILGVVAIAGLYLIAKAMRHRPAVETNVASRPSSQVHAA